MSEQKKICFVVMGFGKKTDFETQRTLDLDQTYSEIIKPAVEACDLRCVRADEVMHSGIIDKPMYQMLLQADLVVADISTMNANAIYELGVRHALCPHSTIVLKEKDGRFHFDLNHINTIEYEHLGKDIGAKEAREAGARLQEMINSVLAEPIEKDSPVYTFLPELAQPEIATEAELNQVIEDLTHDEDLLSAILERARVAVEDSNHKAAKDEFSRAMAMHPDNAYYRQQAALHSYKSEHPNPYLACVNALNILDVLAPTGSNDPETLGIAGAVHKKLYSLTENADALRASLELYHRGFSLNADYYTGENAAMCFELLSQIEEDADEVAFQKKSAEKIRQSIYENLQQEIGESSFADRSDQMWVYATLANCSLALGKPDDFNKFDKAFRGSVDADWQVKTYENGIEHVKNFYEGAE